MAFIHLRAHSEYSVVDGTLRYRGRPESNVLDYYVDTGRFTADHALHVLVREQGVERQAEEARGHAVGHR